jgi:hypothetical protein
MSKYDTGIHAFDVALSTDGPTIDLTVIDALEQCEAYLEDRADADLEPGDSAHHPNEAMRLLVEIRAALAKAKP